MNKFKSAINDCIRSYVGNLPDEEFAYNQFESVSVKRQKLINELQEKTTLTRLSKQLECAVGLLLEEGFHYFDKNECFLLVSDLLRAHESLTQLNVTPPLPADIQEVLQISSMSLGLILKIALAKFHENQFPQSLSLFALLTTLAPSSSAYWFRLGIAAQRCEQRDLALRAYTVASTFDPTLVGAQIFSAECHLLDDHREKARENCTQARNIMKTTKVEEIWFPLLSEIESVLVGK
jgi:tetratricopeptide (TPR) repeat protein